MRLLLFLLIFTSFLSAEKIDIKLAALPGLSPDGKELLFNWYGDIWKVPIEGGQAERLTNHQADDTSAHFSPDGKKIAFVSSREGYRQAYIMDADGGSPKRIGFMSEGYTIQGWYPGGDKLLVSSYRDNYGRNGLRLYSLPLKRGPEYEIMKAGVRSANLSHDGKRILFTREGEGLYRKGYRGSKTTQIWMFDSESGDIQEVLRGKADYRSPMWAADKKGIYFVCDEDGTNNLWYMNLSSKKKKQLTSFKDDGVILPSISRDGSKIVFRRLFDFYSFDTSSEKSEIIEIYCDEDLDPYKAKQLRSQNTSDIDVTDDGLEIALVSGFDIWVMDKILKEPVRVTQTREIEKEILFSKDSHSIYCIRDSGIESQVLEIKRVGDDHWWQSKEFTEKTILKSSESIHSLKLSPKGKYLSYIKGVGNLYIYDLKEEKETLFVESWDTPSYSWSPDEKWISYALEDRNFNNDVWLKKIGEKEKPFNISQHPDYDGSPSFSPDGKYLAFSTNRNDGGYEIARVTLSKENFEESNRDRTLKKALAAMKARKKPDSKKPPQQTPKKEVKKEDKKTDTQVGKSPDATKKSPEAKKDEAPKKKPEGKGIEIDLEGLNDRIVIYKNPGDDYAPFWSADGKRLTFLNRNGSTKTVQQLSMPDSKKPAVILKDHVTPVKWLTSGDQLYCIYKNTPSLFSKGKLLQYKFSTAYKSRPSDLNLNTFRQVWKTMRDRFYDEKMNNKDWDKIRQKYEDMAAKAPDSVILERVMAMLLGELNASHLGYRSYSRAFKADNSNEITGHLGVKFDVSFKGPGLKIAQVIKGSNAAKEGVNLKVGEIILEIDETACSIDSDIIKLLNGPLQRDIELKVKGLDGTERVVLTRPHTYSQIRTLLYEEIINDNRDVVHKKSENKMGYLHVSRMMWPEFNKFKEEVFKEGNGRDGLIIDVRDNGGGFTADHLISVLTQPRHAVTVPRGGRAGYPYSRQVYLHWYKPVVVLCNQNSFSNAEIFSHAIKTLKRGKLIGVPTAGGVISTGAATILGQGSLRIPFRGWYTISDGEDMELNGAQPDIVIWPLPGEMETGKDVQLEKAIEVLKEEIKNFEDLDKIQLKNASER